MANNGEALQGSLFEDSSAKSIKPDTSSTSFVSNISDLSEKALVLDAETRPRERKEANSFQTINHFNNPETKSDEPLWAHHSLVKVELLTPMLQHYVKLKKTQPERILLYRLGDFFECFFEDAILLSKVLELTLTGKEGGKSIGRVPMAGIPHHAAEKYCAELIRRGKSIAICDQLETTPSKGNLLKRGITRVLTPGTIIEEGMLAAKRNNWLAAVILEENPQTKEFIWGLANADVSTGEFLVTQGASEAELCQELDKIEASEILCIDQLEDKKLPWCPRDVHLTNIAKTPFSFHEAEKTLKTTYQLTNLDFLGLKNMPLALRAGGGLIAYLQSTQPGDQELKINKNNTPPIDLPKKILRKNSLRIDAQTRRNLEITSTQRNGKFYGSLLWSIDQTLTAMGARCLRRWLENPLIDINEIEARQLTIGSLVKERPSRKSLRKLLKPMGDLERLAGRSGAGHCGPRELIAIADGIERLPHLAKSLPFKVEAAPDFIKELVNINPKLIEIACLIRDKIIDNPPLSITEGGIIHNGIDKILDGLRNQLDDQDAWLKSQEDLERRKSENPNLKLQYHRTFGYFLSVTRAKANKVPEHWIRRQTLANEERFVTPELKAREGKIFQLRARSSQREYEIFCKVREEVGIYSSEIRKAARAIAGLDSIVSLAEVASTNNYCCPEIAKPSVNKKERILQIEGSRHPVVEQLLVEEYFVPNDLLLGEGTDLIILTGPNASGKSCYLRQIGLIQLLSQIGSWVPAKKARISIADQIFTRVGAVDDLAAGQSTFMVEMAETAYILHHATDSSLVLLDEIGRGTATYDGLSIAWAVSEFLAENIRSKTIFATHYHELKNLSKRIKSIENFQVLVQETGDDLIFMHRVVPGGASKSYGIEAAKLAGVSKEVIIKAKHVLKQLEDINEATVINTNNILINNSMADAA